MIPWFDGINKWIIGGVAGLSLTAIVALVLAYLRWREEQKKQAAMDALLVAAEAQLDTLEEIHKLLNKWFRRTK